MGNKDRIYNLLKKRELTNKEIAKKTNLSINETRVYVNRLKKENKVKSIGKKERYKIYKAIETKDEKNNQYLDTLILKKLIPKFIEKGIKVDLGNKEVNRLEQLIKEVM